MATCSRLTDVRAPWGFTKSTHVSTLLRRSEMDSGHHPLFFRDKEPLIAPCTTVQQCHNAMGSCSVMLQGDGQGRLAVSKTNPGFLHSMD